MRVQMIIFVSFAAFLLILSHIQLVQINSFSLCTYSFQMRVNIVEITIDAIFLNIFPFKISIR